MTRFNFGNIVVVEGNLVGVVVKCWEHFKKEHPQGWEYNYDVYVRSYNGVKNYQENEIEQFVYDKEKDGKNNMPTQKPRIELIFQDDVSMCLSYTFKDKNEYVVYRYMSGDVIPERIIELMLPKMLEGLGKKIALSLDESQKVEENTK